MTKLFPYSSPEARTAAGEMLVAGQWSLNDPDGYPKPKSPPLDELLWDIGRAPSPADSSYSGIEASHVGLTCSQRAVV